MSKCDGWVCKIIETYQDKFKVRFTLCSDDYDAGTEKIVSASRVVLDCLYCHARVYDANNKKCSECGNLWNEELKYEEYDYEKEKEEKRKIEYKKAVDNSWVMRWEHVPGGDYYWYNKLTHKRK